MISFLSFGHILFDCGTHVGPRAAMKAEIECARLQRLSDLAALVAQRAAERGHAVDDQGPPDIPRWGELGVVGAFPAEIVKFISACDLWVHSLAGGPPAAAPCSAPPLGGTAAC